MDFSKVAFAIYFPVPVKEEQASIPGARKIAT